MANQSRTDRGINAEMETGGQAFGARSAAINKEMMEQLLSLCQLDIDAVAIYALAADRIEDREYQTALLRFKADHERHVLNMTNVILGFGGEPPMVTHDGGEVKTLGMISLKGFDTDLGVLKAMVTNEVFTNESYDQALAMIPEDDALRLMLEGHRDDERRHLEYLQDVVLRQEHGGKVSTPELEKRGADFIDLDQNRGLQH